MNSRSRRALQILTGVLGVIPVATGLIGFLGLRDPLYVHYGVIPNAALDSNLRFFSGVWLGVGITIFAMLPKIERSGPLFRALWLMIFLGGIGRIFSLISAGLPPTPFLGILVLEIVGAPVFVLWQATIERASSV